jgi:starch synthase (maltosyl-transferring)
MILCPTRDALRLPRVLALSTPDPASVDAALAQAAALGFNAVLLTDSTLSPDALAPVADVCRTHHLTLLLDLDLSRFDAGHPLVRQYPEAFAVRRRGTATLPIDPRTPAQAIGEARPRLFDPDVAAILHAWAGERITAQIAAGVGGYRVLGLDAGPPSFWRGLIQDARRHLPSAVFIGSLAGAPRSVGLGLGECGFDSLTSSLAWWDGRARWLVEEYEALRAIAPLAADLTALETLLKAGACRISPPLRSGGGGPREAWWWGRAQRMPPPSAAPPPPPLRRGGEEWASTRAYLEVDRTEPILVLAAALGSGFIIPQGFDDAAVRRANALVPELASVSGEVRRLSADGAAVTALLRADGPDVRRAAAALLVLINPDGQRAASPDAGVLALAGADFEPFQAVNGVAEPFAPLNPGEVRLLRAKRAQPIVRALPPAKKSAKFAAHRCPRLVVENVAPTVQGGAFPVRRIVGETVSVEADVFADGHEYLSVELRWRADDASDWQTTPMAPLGNDRWGASFALPRLGRYHFTIEGWLDRFGGYRRDLAKKLDAGVALAVDFDEGRALVAAAAARVDGPLGADLRDLLARLDALGPDEASGRSELLLSEGLAALMQAADDRPFSLTLDPPQLVDAEPLQARFASWYELFPRSQTNDPTRHGTFDDVIARLPAIRAMGFDVLYFPPIHPIGTKNRKGANNSLTAEPGEPGSPYAIGSDAGGHEAIHPELGGFDAFRRLIAAATAQGLEIALDFAIQCAPDHPWIRAHPGWFDWRPDGTIKYAENPPKKYQDIVNVDFYAPGAVPDLWLALRDVVLLWVREGVRLFRVDNPHTKPLPFWEWMIREVRSLHPDVIFLAEAFTRPKPMYRLAKAGFSQSYTYFTWRQSKAEFIDYLTELTTTAPKEFYRPHFFVNTPDINPQFLQTSGRGGFLIRAALAATLSGLWGVYSGFELCEADPLPGREEYNNSEKYQIRVRDWTQPGNIIAEIATLNRVRKSQPALQSHLGVRFYSAFNDQILYFGKSAHFADPTRPLDEIVLVAISLDPRNPQGCEVEVPLWEWGLSDAATVEVEDLITETRFAWSGKRQAVHLTPDRPYALWRVQPVRSA